MSCRVWRSEVPKWARWPGLLGSGVLLLSLSCHAQSAAETPDESTAATSDVACEAQLQACRRAAETAQGSAGEAQAVVQALRAKLKAVERERAALERRMAEMIRESAAERVGLEARLVATEIALRQAQARAQAAEARLDQALALVPPRAGGAASAAEARERALAANRDYLQRYAQAKRSGSDGTPALAEARARLFHAQSLLAELEGARGVYTITAQDTLSRIAARTLGNGNLWVRIYSANRHVLDDPDRLTPGVTLVIP